MKPFKSLVALGLMLALSPALADEVSVAVAANFAAPMKKIAAAFEKATGHRVIVAAGSTGKLYAQIRNGAPFEVLLAADEKTPAKLETEGLAVPGSRFTYAVGKLVLWSRTPGFVDTKGDVLRKGGFAHIAVANPKLAPYGAAGVEALKKLGVYEALEPRMVLGENITQTYQFVASGNAEIGFVALSQVQDGEKPLAGSLWKVPDTFYTPIRQDAVLLANGRNKTAATALLGFLRGGMAREIARSYGYGP